MKNKKRFLSVVLCFLMLFLVGCNNVLEDNGVSVKAFDGVKVLTRPADYFDNIGEIVGDNASENYYNIFVANVLSNLYRVYEKLDDEEINSDIFNDASNNSDPNSIIGAHKDKENNMKYYFYDSLRYTITGVDVTKNEGADIPTSVTLTLTPNSWKWTLKTQGLGKNFFQKIDEKDANDYINISGNDVIISENFFGGEEISEWTKLYEGEFKNDIPSFSEFYVGPSINKSDSVVNYYASPYYTQDNDDTKEKNFFQDALEYATYMFVLGFDYMNEGEGGATSVVPNLFKFAFTEDDTEGITGMKVAGWNADGTMNFENAVANISVEDALGFAKEFYKKNGNIVGVTEEIKGKVARFIKDEVIGDGAFLEGDTNKEGKFTVTTTTTTGSTKETESQTFNRNYDQVIKNIIDYACEQAPIGFDETSNETVKLGQAYMASEITDFPNNTFMLNDDDNDAHALDHVPLGEYQSMIFFPQDKDIGEALGTLILAFEYNENPLNQVMLDQLDLTVGLRYYDHEAKAYTVDVQTEKSVKRGKYNEVNNADSPDETWLIIDNSDDQSAVDLPMPKDLKMKTKFVNEPPIRAGALNYPISMMITGTNAARNYYKPNNSAYGTFGSLYGQVGDTADNSYKCWGLEHNCDYLEVYFLVHKTSGEMNTNYNFKVGIRAFLASYK